MRVAHVSTMRKEGNYLHIALFQTLVHDSDTIFIVASPMVEFVILFSPT